MYNIKHVARTACSYKTVEDFWDIHFSCVTVDCQVGGPVVDVFPGFSGAIFAVLIYYFAVGNIGRGTDVGVNVDVNCTHYMTAMFFNSILRHLLESVMQELLQISSKQDYL